MNRELPPDADLQPPLDPRELPYTIARWRGDLPHLHKVGATYFVTFCLQEAVPARLQRRPLSLGDAEPEGIASRSEPPVTSPRGLLVQSHISELVERALLCFDGERYLLHAWCVMPDHVHAVVTPLPEHSLSSVLHTWKSFTAHRVNRVVGRKGRLWESESFDHMVRNAEQLKRFVAYVERNPVAAGLTPRQELWPASSARFRHP